MYARARIPVQHGLHMALRPHEDLFSFEVADIYIAKDFSIINDNNFKLIKRVFKKELA